MPGPPNVFAFRSRFSEFNDVADPEIDLGLQIAQLWVDPLIWDPNDYPMALLFWAAHFVSLKRLQLASVEFGGSGAVDLFVRSIGIGERRVMFGERGAYAKGEASMGPGEALLEQTIYGMLYLTLRARNVPSVLVI
jgi:hypothetical protein